MLVQRNLGIQAAAAAQKPCKQGNEISHVRNVSGSSD